MYNLFKAIPNGFNIRLGLVSFLAKTSSFRRASKLLIDLLTVDFGDVSLAFVANNQLRILDSIVSPFNGIPRDLPSNSQLTMVSHNYLCKSFIMNRLDVLIRRNAAISAICVTVRAGLSLFSGSNFSQKCIFSGRNPPERHLLESASSEGQESV